MAQAAFWARPDTEPRRRGEQTGLDTLVVHAVNDAYQVWDGVRVVPCRSLRDEYAAWGLRAQA